MEKINIDIIAVGMDQLQSALHTAEDRVNGFDEAYPKLKRREKRNKILTIILSTIVTIIIEVIAIAYEDVTWMTLIFIAYITIIVFCTNSKIPSKVDQKKQENDNNKKMAEYITRTRDNINLLLEKKEELYDFYLSPSQDEQVLMFVAPELNEKGEEIGKFHSIYINELKLIKDGKYSSLIIESNPNWAIGYKTYLEMPYKLFKQSATWLK